MEITTASIGTSTGQHGGQGSEGGIITSSMVMDCYHVLAKCVFLDNIDTNSRHVNKGLVAMPTFHCVCYGSEWCGENSGPVAFHNILHSGQHWRLKNLFFAIVLITNMDCPFKKKGVLHMSWFAVVELICNKFSRTRNAITVNEYVYKKLS